MCILDIIIINIILSAACMVIRKQTFLRPCFDVVERNHTAEHMVKIH